MDDTKYVYRFRGISALLDGYHELENQEIYFAAPEELNDPMEGFYNITWEGDRILWKNLLRHYTLCLFITMYDCLSGKNISDKDYLFPITASPDDLPSEYRQDYDEICHKFFLNELVDDFILSIVNGEKIDKNELLYYLNIIHFFALDSVCNYFNNKTEAFFPFDAVRYQEKISKSYAFYKRIKFAKIKQEDLYEKLLLSNYFVVRQKQILNYIDAKISKRLDEYFILSGFPYVYIEKLPLLILPDWYTACFMEECNNASVWGHYADGHKGCCLKFKKENNSLQLYQATSIHFNKLNETKDRYGYSYVPMRFEPINYKQDFYEINFFKSLGNIPSGELRKYWLSCDNVLSCLHDSLYGDEGNFRHSYWESFSKITTTKSKDWEYEKELRLIAPSMIIDKEQKNMRKFKYKFDDLDGIIFGINTSNDDIMNVISIIQSKCHETKRESFDFYQAYYNSFKGNIDFHKL